MLEAPAPSRREVLMITLGSAVILAILAALTITIWSTAYRPVWISVGPVDEYPQADQPYLIVDGEFRAWMISTSSGFTVFNERSPATQCRYQWTPSNNRFEDPCCGGKWTLDGELLPPARPDATDLWRYPVEVTDGLIRVNSSEIIRPPFPEAEGKSPCLS